MNHFYMPLIIFWVLDSEKLQCPVPYDFQNGGRVKKKTHKITSLKLKQLDLDLICLEMRFYSH